MTTAPEPQTANQRAVYRRRNTTVLDAKTYLIDKLFGPAIANDSTSVTWGPANESDLRDLIVVVGDVEGDDDFSELGDSAQDEDYTISVSFWGYAQGGSAREATAAAFGLYDAASMAIRADRTFGGLVFSSLLRFRRFEEGRGREGTSRVTVIHAGVRIKARI